MPITLACTCGKPLRVADQFAGRLVKCPVCGATQRAGQPAVAPAAPPPFAPQPAAPAAETSDDFEVIEDTIPATKPASPKTAAAPAPDAPAANRLKAAVVEEEKPATPGITGQPKKPKKKRKKKSEGGGEKDDGWYDRMRDNEAWMKRVFRGSAYIVTGVLILIGVGIIYSQYWAEIKEEGGQAVGGVILFGIMGLVSIGKGIIGIAFGQFLGDDE
jgi:hypothetical protein